MPHQQHNWTITAGDNYGTLSHDQKGAIIFGSRKGINRQRRGGAGNLQAIDLSDMAHGVDDSADQAVPCFIAAADLIERILGAPGRKVYLHCGHGNSRTAFAMMTYLVRHGGGFSWDEATAFVTAGQSERHDINFQLDTHGPNGSYLGWLGAAQARITDLQERHTARRSWLLQDKGRMVYLVAADAPKRVKVRRTLTVAPDPVAEAREREALEPQKKKRAVQRRTEAERLVADTVAFLGPNWATYRSGH
ncbi:hypothetical protein ABQJ54_02055 [Rhodanobacter sp. Si-c]|uniref:Tyrosine specific protein phosphatases domain-containing protein n=1 Tax=Rhodanobacter lycopersici TaxID=3162487 RepID=A0ABV3QAC1_9GAMM